MHSLCPRKSDAIPGLCLGFQMAVIEYARNVCGIPNANSREFEPTVRTR